MPGNCFIEALFNGKQELEVSIVGVKCLFALMVITSLLAACVGGQPTEISQQEDQLTPAIQDEGQGWDQTLDQPDGVPGLNLVERTLERESQDPPYEIQAVWPNLEGDPGLSSPFNAEVDHQISTAVESFQDQVQGADSTDEGRPSSWLTVDYELTFASDRLVSLYLMFDTYITFSAHPFPTSQSLTYDAITGRLIDLADLFRPGVDPLPVILGEVEQALLARDLGFADGTVESVLQARENWNLMAEGLRLNFDVYEVGPYAAGPQDVLIPWELLSPLLDPDGPAEIFLTR
jgi:hypothetical protein